MPPSLQFKPKRALRNGRVTGTDIKSKDEYTLLHKTYLKSISTFYLSIEQVILMYHFDDSQICSLPNSGQLRLNQSSRGVGKV